MNRLLSNYKVIEWSSLFLLVILWASAYSLTSIAISQISPIIVVAIRLWIGALFLYVFCRFFKKPIPFINDLRAWGSMAATGIIGSLIPFFLISSAQTYIKPSALASIYLSATPMAATILAHIFIKGEKIGLKSMFGVLLGILGVVILLAPDIFGKQALSAPIWAQMILVLAAFCYGGALIIVRLTSPKIDAIAISFGFVFCSAIAASPFALFEYFNSKPVFRIHDITSAVLLGLGPTAIASILYVQMVHKIGPVLVANFSNLVPFASIFIGYVLFQEKIPPTAGFALFVILAGVYILQKR